MHSVVLVGFEEGERVVIADPGAGIERWSMRGVEELWTGEVMYLEPDD